MSERDPVVRIDAIYGNCPVQADGMIDGKPFYFRARGSSWSIGIGGERVLDPEWWYGEDYGYGPYDAGWMPQYEALAFIAQSVELYAKGYRSDE